MVRQDGMPALVYWGLYGLGTRRSAAMFMWGCLIVGVLAALASIRRVEHGWYTAFFLAALWYWYAMRWVDKHGSWESEAAPSARPESERPAA